LEADVALLTEAANLPAVQEMIYAYGGLPIGECNGDAIELLHYGGDVVIGRTGNGGTRRVSYDDVLRETSLDDLLAEIETRIARRIGEVDEDRAELARHFRGQTNQVAADLAVYDGVRAQCNSSLDRVVDLRAMLEASRAPHRPRPRLVGSPPWFEP
jgi:hypothetical protein